MSNIHLVLKLDEALRQKAEEVAKDRGFDHASDYLKMLLEADIARVDTTQKEEQLKV